MYIMCKISAQWVPHIEFHEAQFRPDRLEPDESTGGQRKHSRRTYLPYLLIIRQVDDKHPKITKCYAHLGWVQSVKLPRDLDLLGLALVSSRLECRQPMVGKGLPNFISIPSTSM